MVRLYFILRCNQTTLQHNMLIAIAWLCIIIKMTTFELQYNKHSLSSYFELNVFERLTLKKQQSATDLTRSAYHPKAKVLPHPVFRSAITPKVTDRKPQKTVQKVHLPPDDYTFVMFPVQYAETDFVINIQSPEVKNSCTVRMNYLHYEVTVNGIQHKFTMPLMKVSIKFIKVILPQWSPIAVVLSPVKGRIKQSAIETDNNFGFALDKQITQVNPFAEIEQSELKRKTMLLKKIPILRLGKLALMTEMPENEEPTTVRSFLTPRIRACLTSKFKTNEKSHVQQPLLSNRLNDTKKYCRAKEEQPKTTKGNLTKISDYFKGATINQVNSPRKKRPQIGKLWSPPATQNPLVKETHCVPQ